MATYKFPEFSVQIVNPNISVVGIGDSCDGNASVTVMLALGQPEAQATKFSITLYGFTYVGDQPMRADADAWALVELAKYEV